MKMECFYVPVEQEPNKANAPYVAVLAESSEAAIIKVLDAGYIVKLGPSFEEELNRILS